MEPEGSLPYSQAAATGPYPEWVPVTTVWRVLRLRMEELPTIWSVAANILNKPTADNGWFFSCGGLGEA